MEVVSSYDFLRSPHTDQSVSRDPKRPTVVLILADNLGWGELGCYGRGFLRGTAMPRIDAFTKEGLRRISPCRMKTGRIIITLRYGSLTIRLCLALFSYWQYPQLMFIDREAFVQEFESNPIHSEVCSPRSSTSVIRCRKSTLKAQANVHGRWGAKLIRQTTRTCPNTPELPQTYRRQETNLQPWISGRK
ncbi:hypothetical protein F4818DRAFT_348328 [Hypoxylon cercidicola]|nr:hypothetical protein F4818DRAFT_348328 [Hypoxylon cercidicola]